MKNLTLPIEIGKRYVRRDGVVITAQKSPPPFSADVCYVGINPTPTDDNNDYVWMQTGRTRTEGMDLFDLIGDGYQPTDYRDVLQMIIDGAPLQFISSPSTKQWVDTTASTCLANISTLTIDPKCWRTKVEPFIVNGVELTERPMTEVPPVGTVYWYVDLVGATMVESAEWQNYQFDIRALARGIAHHSEAGASAHANALLFNQKVKTDHVNTSN